MCRIPSKALAILAAESAKLARQDEILAEIAPLKRQIRRLQSEWIWSF